MENNLFFDYGPVWIKKKLGYDKRYMDSRACPIPGGITCGPVITEKTVIRNDESLAASLTDATKLREANKVEVVNRHSISKKFPLTFDSFLKPLQDLPSHYKLPGSLDKRFHHSTVLNSYTLNGKNHIVYGQSSGDSCSLNIASVVNGFSENEGNLSLNNIQKICNYKLLYQTDCAVINGNPHILLKADNRLMFLNVKEQSFDFCSVVGSNTLDCCLSRDFSSRFAFTNRDGTLNLFNVNTERVMWRHHFDITLSKGEEYLGCEFSCNPSCINLACHSKVFSVDTRIADNKLTLFETTKMNDYLQGYNENICAIKNVPNLPLLYVTCSETTFLMDKRNCKYPVLSWCHMIKARPSYSQYFQDCGIDYHMVVDPFKSQLCFVSSLSDKSEFPDISIISTPKHVNIINDTFSVARKQGIWFTEHIEREMCSPIVGVTVLPLEIGSVICLQNNNGNLFYLNAVHRKVKSICSEGSNSTKDLKMFEKSLFKSSYTKEKSTINKSKVNYIEGLKLRYFYKGKNVVQKLGTESGFVWNIKSMAKSVNYSKLYDDDVLDKLRKREKTENNSFLSHFSTKSQKRLSDEFIKSCSDSTSELFLNVWNESKEEKDDAQPKRAKHRRLNARSHNALAYHNLPYFVNVKDVAPPLFFSENNDINSNHNDEDDFNSNNNDADKNEDSIYSLLNSTIGNNLTSIENITTDLTNVSKIHGFNETLTDNSVMGNNNETPARSAKIKTKKKSKSEGF